MRAKLQLFAALAIALVALAHGFDSPSQGQDPGGTFKEKKAKGGKGAASEDDKIAKIAAKGGKQSETEREKLLKGLSKAAARSDDGPPRTGAGEFDDWFQRLTNGRGVWVRSEIAHKPLVEMFDRMADRLGVTNEQITREQFHKYARAFLTEGESPPWTTDKVRGVNEADKMFEHLDANGDGVLSPEEMSESLLAVRGRWDTNRDGVIDRDEYRAYFQGRIQQWQAERAAADSSPRRAVDDQKPPVFRAGKLPPELPAWFAKLDLDHDGQIGLYEWKESRWPIEDFRRLDRNDDGFLTVDEVLWHVARAKDRETPERELLVRKLPGGAQTTNDGSGAKGKKKKDG